MLWIISLYNSYMRTFSTKADVSSSMGAMSASVNAPASHDAVDIVLRCMVEHRSKEDRVEESLWEVVL